MGAYEKALRERGLGFGRLLGAYPILTLLGVLVFYLIVTGWVLHYLTSALTGVLLDAGPSDDYFNQFSGHSQSIFWQFLAVILTGGILVFGISRGIEKATKVMMPLPPGAPGNSPRPFIDFTWIRGRESGTSSFRTGPIFSSPSPGVWPLGKPFFLSPSRGRECWSTGVILPNSLTFPRRR